MATKKSSKNKKFKLKNINSVFSENFPLKKFDLNPSGLIAGTQKKISNFYVKFKKEREKEEKKLEKKRIIDAKKELIKQKKQEQKENLDKVREKRQILEQETDY